MSWFMPGTWTHCKAKDAGRECKRKDHISHKKSWGKWYGLLSHNDPRDQGYGKNKPRPKPKPNPVKKKGWWT